MSGRVMEVGGRAIEVSNPGKLLFPDCGLTKWDLADYYRRIAPTALPHYAGRAVTMQRFPDGIGEDGFFQKNAPDHFPDWIERIDLPKEGGTVRHLLVGSAAALVYLADQGCITPHLALARAEDPDRPDRLVFDLDPSDDDFSRVREVAAALRELLEDRGLPSFVQVTGSRGLHVAIPLDRSAGHDALRGFARETAREVAGAHPRLATTEQRKDRRGDRVLIDTFRTAHAQTAVAPYAVRARPGAPVATPLRWEEALDPGMTPRRYTVANIFRRLGQTGDPWEGIDEAPVHAADLAGDLPAG